MTTWHYIPEDSKLHIQFYCEQLIEGNMMLAMYKMDDKASEVAACWLVRILTKPHVVPNEQFTIYFSSTL
jgi:hypothetical protein